MGTGSNGMPDQSGPRGRSGGYQDDLVDLDDQLRAEFAASFPRRIDSRQALAEARPAMVRARRVRIGRQLVGASTATVALTAAVVFSLGQLRTPAGDDLIMVDAAAGAESAPETSDIGIAIELPAKPDEGDEENPATTDPSGASSAAITSPEDASSTDSTADTTADPDTTVDPSTSAPTPTTSTSSATSTTTAPTTSTTPSTAPPVTTSATTIDSQCGSIVVAHDGSRLQLIDVQPKGSHTVEEQNVEPEKIKVKFRKSGSECELIAEWRNGRLVTDVEQE